MKGPTPIISSMLAEVAPNNPMPRMRREDSVSGKRLRYHSRRFGACIAYVLLIAAGAQGQSPLQNALELTRHGQYQEARGALKGVPTPGSVPQQIAFHRLKAAIASGLKETRMAAREMEAALALDPADSGLLLATAVAEFADSELEPALLHVQASSESAPREALMGDIFAKQGKTDVAVTAYETAIRMAPDDERYRLALGLNLIVHGRPTEAIEVLRDSCLALPRSVRIRTLLGVAQYAAGYSDDAALSFQDAIALDPGAEAPHAALARIVLQSSGVPSRRAIDSLCPWNATVCAAMQLRVARSSGDQEFLARSVQMLKRVPENDPIGKCELARAYEWEGDLKAARIELENCVRLDPSPQNHYRLGLLYKRLGLPALAAREMERRKQLMQMMSEETALARGVVETDKNAGH